MRKLSIFLLISLFVIGVQGATVAQETNEQEPALESVSESLNDAQEAPPQEQEANVLEASKPAKIITAVEITGNKSISTNTILSKMKARVGDPYLENVISDDLKRLYLLGFFSDINIDTQDYKDGLKVVVAVVERPIIEKVTFSGMTRITMKDEKLKGMLKTKEGQYLDYPNLTEDVQTLKGMYEKKGFGAVDIQYTVATDEATQKTTVQFVVQEGKRIRIKRITVAGNEHFSDKRIIKLMKTRPAWLFNAGVLKEDVLEEDMERIRSFYHKQGFTDVVVNYNVTSDARKPFLYITVSVEEGKKYLVGNVVIEGNKDISLKELLAKVKECAPGDVFSQEGMQQDIVAISGLYFDRGYIMATVDETTSLNAYTSRVDIKYTITENTIAFVDKIKIRGNIKTKDVVIRRELRIKPGDKFDGEKLRRSKERLQNLGFFEDVSYDTEDTQVSDKKDLVVDVKESKTGAFSFGGGYSTIEQFVGFIEIEQKNFDWKNIPYFTGDGQNLKLRASFGTLSNSYLLSFTEPWFFDYPVSFGFDAYRRSYQRESDVGYGYDEDVTGGALRFGKELTEYIRGDIRYRYDLIKITDITENASEALLREYGKNSISSVETALTFDSRDNVFDTRKGDLVTASFEGAGGPFGGTKDFMKFYGRASHYFPLFLGSSLEIRGRLGLVEPYGDSEEVPIYERFFAGGTYTIRGYDERKVGPVDPISKDPLGGEALLVGNIEYTYPVFSFLKLAAFYDVGNVWSKRQDFAKEGEYKSGYGLGVRLKTPIGPLMLDYGFPVDVQSGETEKKSGRLHFSMSQGF